MSDETTSIVKQASQGSVAAIIQVLNEELIDDGVRTRAIFADGVLQLLCEAATLDQLDQSTLPGRIQHILETIAPHNIRRVKINSRIVREQQLLWLEEINRDPQNQLLWSEEITLRRPNLFQRLLAPRPAESNPSRGLLPTLSPHKLREKRQFWRGLLGGAGLGVLLLGSWLLYQRLNPTPSEVVQTSNPTASPLTSSTQAIDRNGTVSNAAPSPVASKPVRPSTDPFVHAVRIAEKAAQDGVSAKSLAEWLELAAQWQKASDLMASVPSTDQRYSTAQERAQTYQKNREFALAYVKKLQVDLPQSTDLDASAEGEATGQTQ